MSSRALLRRLLPLLCAAGVAAGDVQRQGAPAWLHSRRGSYDAAASRELLDGSLEGKRRRAAAPKPGQRQAQDATQALVGLYEAKRPEAAEQKTGVRGSSEQRALDAPPGESSNGSAHSPVASEGSASGSGSGASASGNGSAGHPVASGADAASNSSAGSATSSNSSAGSPNTSANESINATGFESVMFGGKSVNATAGESANATAGESVGASGSGSVNASGNKSVNASGNKSVNALGKGSEAHGEKDDFPDDDLNSCRKICLEEIAKPPEEGMAVHVPGMFHGKILSGEVKESLGKMHEEDLQELLRSQQFEMNLLTPAGTVNAVLKDLASRYISYRERERASSCNLEWKPFQCPNGRSIAAIRMNHLWRDHWKMARTRRSSCMHGFQINWTDSVHPGVLAKAHPSFIQNAVKSGYIRDPHGMNLGNVGAALAHITLWEEMVGSFEEDDVVLAMEDNALFRPETLTGICNTIATAADFDILNLAVMRPNGEEVDGELGLYRARKQVVIEPYPNIWMSSYLITGRGAQKLLECIKRVPRDFGSPAYIVDRVVSFQCVHGDPHIAAFFVNHYRYFGHTESGGDSRQKYNRPWVTVTRPPLPSGAASLLA